MAKRKKFTPSAAPLLNGEAFWVIPLVSLLSVVAITFFLSRRAHHSNTKFDWGINDMRCEDYHRDGQHHHRGK